jgi:hypothetical protein
MLAGRTGMSIDGFEHLELTYQRPPSVHPKSISFCKERASTGRMQQIQIWTHWIRLMLTVLSCSVHARTRHVGKDNPAEQAAWRPGHEHGSDACGHDVLGRLWGGGSNLLAESA